MNITIVNDKDIVIGYKERRLLNKSDIYRVSALWITNSKGQILLARRSVNKKHHPGKWGPAVAGTVEKGETYESNIIKETSEEIGITNFTPIKKLKLKNNGQYKHFTQWFAVKINKNINEFIIQKEEVEEIKWFTIKELKIDLDKNPDKFLSSIKRCVDEFE